MKERMALTNSMEDYLEAISILEENKKYVRVRDIASHMNVKMPSVTGALKSLAEKKLVIHEKYEYVELTKQGAVVAQEIRRRHGAILRFLTEVLNIEPEAAERDSCGMEHAISTTTMNRLLKLIECMNECPNGTPGCLKRFQHYVEHGEKSLIAFPAGVGNDKG